MGSLAPPLSATTESFGRHEVNGPTAGGKERGEGDGPGEGDGEGDGVQQNQGFGVGSESVYALTEPSAGRANDPGMVMQHNVNLHLSAAHLPGQTPARALCDSAFGYSPFLSPLPRRNQALYNMLGDDRRRALSASRIIVEWAFGEASMLFPYIEGLLHMKIFQTRPGLAFRVAHLFLNFKHCMVGANATLYGECFPPTLQTYMV